jgi:sarcosine oxidase subunit alpha
MQVGCAHRMARTYGLLPGSEAVFSVGHDLGLEAAIDLFDLGLKIHCVADIREDGQNPELMLALAERRIPVLKGWVAAKAHGGKHVEKVTLTTVEGTVKRDFTCDLLVASAGLTPVTGPFILAQAKMGYDSHTGYFLPTETAGKDVSRRPSHRHQPSRRHRSLRPPGRPQGGSRRRRRHG